MAREMHEWMSDSGQVFGTETDALRADAKYWKGVAEHLREKIVRLTCHDEYADNPQLAEAAAEALIQKKYPGPEVTGSNFMRHRRLAGKEGEDITE